MKSSIQTGVNLRRFDWTWYPRPTYVGIGPHHGQDGSEFYVVQGLV
ncbi:MAG: hypothetical protein ABGZ35_31290 [Planctomycetaceae bacterium]